MKLHRKEVSRLLDPNILMFKSYGGHGTVAGMFMVTYHWLDEDEKLVREEVVWELGRSLPEVEFMATDFLVAEIVIPNLMQKIKEKERCE